MDPDKNLIFDCDLDLWPTSTNVSNGTSTCDGKHLCHIIMKSIYNCRGFGSDKFEQTDGRMHIHQTDIVTILSGSPQVGSTKMVFPLTTQY